MLQCKIEMNITVINTTSAQALVIRFWIAFPDYVHITFVNLYHSTIILCY